MIHVHDEVLAENLQGFRSELAAFVEGSAHFVVFSSRTFKLFLCRAGSSSILTFALGVPFVGWLERPEYLWADQSGRDSGCRYMLAMRTTSTVIGRTVHDLGSIYQAIESMQADSSLGIRRARLCEYAAAADSAAPTGHSAGNLTEFAPSAIMADIYGIPDDRGRRSAVRIAIDWSNDVSDCCEIAVQDDDVQRYHATDYLLPPDLTTFADSLIQLADGEQLVPSASAFRQQISLTAFRISDTLALLRCGLGESSNAIDLLSRLQASLAPQEVHVLQQRCDDVATSYLVGFESAMIVDLEELRRFGEDLRAIARRCPD